MDNDRIERMLVAFANLDEDVAFSAGRVEWLEHIRRAGEVCDSWVKTNPGNAKEYWNLWDMLIARGPDVAVGDETVADLERQDTIASRLQGFYLAFPDCPIDYRALSPGLSRVNLRLLWALAAAGETKKLRVKLSDMRDFHSDPKYRNAWQQSTQKRIMERFGESQQPTQMEIMAVLEARQEAIQKRIIEILEWLAGHVSSLTVCENPDCRTGLRYFIRTHPREKYCNRLCSGRMKEAQKDKREATKEPKVYVRQGLRAEEIRSKQSMAATLREAKKRAEREADAKRS